MKNSSSEDEPDEGKGRQSPIGGGSDKPDSKVREFMRSFYNDVKFAYTKGFKSTEIDSTDSQTSVTFSQFLKKQIANVGVFWSSLSSASKKVFIGATIFYVVFASLLSPDPSPSTTASYSFSSSAGSVEQQVVAKVGSVIYLAGGETFAIERGTLLHIDGLLYPKGSGEKYIQIGFKCKFIREDMFVIEVFCRR